MATLTGNAQDNTIAGTDQPDTIAGLGGNDTLSGLGEADRLDGGDGSDALLGQDGDDTLVGGEDERVDLLNGGNGDDVLDGGPGADAAAGGLGDDAFFVDDAGDVVTETSGGGRDEVQSSVDFRLGAHVENLALTGGDAINGSGNGLANVVNGNGANNRIDGFDGDDWLNGRGGDDTVFGSDGDDRIFGEDGKDALFGGDGSDQLLGGRGADVMEGGAGDDLYSVINADDAVIEAAGGGADRVVSILNYSLGAEVENLTLANGAVEGVGNKLANTIQGNALGNTLNGAAGADRLAGNAGDDTLYGGSGADLLFGGAGADVFRAIGPAVGRDTILDFSAGEDTLSLQNLAGRNGAPLGTFGALDTSGDGTIGAGDVNVVVSETGLRLLLDGGGTLTLLDANQLGASDVTFG